MTDFLRRIDTAIAHLGIAKTLGVEYAETDLIQAKKQINQALDDARRPENQRKTPGMPRPPGYRSARDEQPKPKEG